MAVITIKGVSINRLKPHRITDVEINDPVDVWALRGYQLCFVMLCGDKLATSTSIKC